MEPTVYEVEAAVEATHWWFVVRRELFAREIARAGVSRDAAVLDVGTGTGSNLRMLRDLGFQNVIGLDADRAAIEWCAVKELGGVQQGDVCAMPFSGKSFGLVIATDVIEHVDHDRQALIEIHRVLAPGGKALITVPAFASLWGLQDVRSHHKRRYRIEGLLELIGSAGLAVERSYYFNYLLFVPIWIARRAIQLSGCHLESENELNAPWLNRLLTTVFRADVRTAPWLRPRWGVSILVLATRPGA